MYRMLMLAGLLVSLGCGSETLAWPAGEVAGTPPSAEELEREYMVEAMRQSPSRLTETRVRVPDEAAELGAWRWAAWLSGSTIGLDRAERRVFVADADAKALAVYRGPSDRQRVELGGAPAQLVVDALDRVWLTLRDSGDLVQVTWVDGEPVVNRVEVCIEPIGLAMSPDGGSLYVACGADGMVVAVDSESLEIRWEVRVRADPRALAASPDGGSVSVTHLTGGVVSRITFSDQRGPDVSARILATHAPQAGIAERSLLTAAGAGGAVFSPFQRRLFVPHLVRDLGVPAQPRPTFAYYAPPPQEPVRAAARPRLSMLDEAGYAPVRLWGSAPSDSVTPGQPSTRGSNLPSLPAHSPVEGMLLVPMLATRTVVAYTTDTDLAPARPIAVYPVGSGPSGVAFRRAAPEAFVWCALDRTIWVLEFGKPRQGRSALKPSWRWTGGDRVLSTRKSLGRQAFYEAGRGLSGNSTVACAVCHPEGRTDGAIWQLPGRDVNPPSLAGRLAGTEPFNWTGDQISLAGKVHEAVERMGGATSATQAMQRIDDTMEWLLSLPAPPSPGLDPDLVELGRTLFASRTVGCAQCHSGPAYTDRRSYRLEGRRQVIDVPSLIGVASSAPYFHDGRVASLEEVIDDNDALMGNTAQLDGRERAALVAYLKSL